MDDEIVGGPFQHFINLTESGAQNPSQILQGGGVGVFEVRFVTLWKNPGLEGKARRVGRKHGEAVRLRRPDACPPQSPAG